MRLHHHPLSSYSRKTTIGIGLRGDDIALVELDPLNGGLRDPAFLALSPFGKMPVLELEGGAVFESTSILEHLEALGPRRLIPVEPALAQRARHYDRLGDHYLLEPIGAFFWSKSPEVREKTVTTMNRAWALWARELADGRAFLCGDAITLADLSAAVAADYALTEGVGLPDAITPYYERLYANPVLRASHDAAMFFVEATRPRRGG